MKDRICNTTIRRYCESSPQRGESYMIDERTKAIGSMFFAVLYFVLWDFECAVERISRGCLLCSDAERKLFALYDLETGKEEAD